jgi:nicotinamidase-related amidase
VCRMIAEQKLTAGNSALVLIDHQKGIIDWVRSIDNRLLKLNTKLIAKTAKALAIPTVISTSMETGANGLLIPAVTDSFPGHPRIQRHGIVNAWDDPAFVAQIKGTGRKVLIMAGVTSDVCLVLPVLSALAAGFHVYVLSDASGSITKISDDVALDRMARAGAVVTSTQTTVAELTDDWTSASGQKVSEVLMKDFLPFHLMRLPFLRRMRMLFDFILNGRRYQAEFRRKPAT